MSRKKNSGRRSWTLFWSSIVNILGFLIISPLSAGLLSVQDKLVARKADFSAISMPHNTPLNMTADDETYIRATSALLHDLKTSAWLSNDYAILPFWPTNSNIPLGATLAGIPQTWESTTRIFKVELDCSPMEMVAVGSFIPSTSLDYIVSSDQQLSNTSYSSLKLQSKDGCSYGIAWESDFGFWTNGRGWWTDLSGINQSSINRDDVFHSALCNISTECSSREMFFFGSSYNNGSLQARGEVCSTSYYGADITTTVSISTSASQVSFDQHTFDSNKGLIDSAFINISSVESLFHSSIWEAKFRSSDYNEKQAIVNGPLIPITARYNFDIGLILSKVDLADIAQRAKQRFFGEALLTTVGVQSAPSSGGLVSVQLERIVVDLGIGVAIGCMLLLSTGMFAAVYFHSRLRNRPLNLARDPGSAATVASLLSYQAKTCACLEGTDRLPGNRLREALGSQKFSMRNGMLITESTSFNQESGEFLKPSVTYTVNLYRGSRNYKTEG